MIHVLACRRGGAGRDMALRRLAAVESHVAAPAAAGGGGAAAAPAAGQRGGGSLPDAASVMRKFKQWEKYLRTAPDRIARIAAEPAAARSRAATAIDAEYDVVVAGFGAAGASAALEAAEAGCSVLVVDRYGGGGSTRRSGGIFYAGGGTAAQKRAGVDDDVDNMYAYLRTEAPACVADDTVRAFCEQSAGNAAWLEEKGIRFAGDDGQTRILKKKSSYPPSWVSLYNSGNEASEPWKRDTRSVPRGHRPHGAGLTGHVLFGALEDAAARHPRITIALHCRCAQLLRGAGGAVTGAVIEQLPGRGDVTGLHSTLHGIGSGSTQLDPTAKVAAACIKLSDMCFNRLALPPREVRARGGVAVCCGGFFFNKSLAQQHLQRYKGLMPLGNIGDDGSGIALGMAAGGAVAQMDRGSAWKFISPPYAFMNGIVVSAGGARVCNEDVYGATLADRLIQQHKGKGWLLLDQRLYDTAMKEIEDPNSELEDYQRVQGILCLKKGSMSAESWDALAKKCKAPPGSFAATIDAYNAGARHGRDVQFGKAEPYVCALDAAPFHAVRMDMAGNKWWPTPCMSLGGLVVHGDTGEVLDGGGRPLRGLYAAGRSAVGVSSNYYLSGLSIADGVFGGRRAGRHAALQALARR